jgi:DNA-binding GntR family transcriptional regulator
MMYKVEPDTTPAVADPVADDQPLRTTISDSLAARLRDDIRSGRISPGSRLRQLEIADRFKVSTTPVREAFATLEREGLVVSAPHRGVVVFRPTITDLQETYEIRIPLESLAIELAVPNMTDEDLAELESFLRQMQAAKDDRGRYNELNAAFHARMYRCARRPKLERIIADLREASAAYLRLYATISPSAEDTHAEHTAIVAACRAKAPKRAAKAMTKHLQHTVDFVSKNLREAEAEAEV